MVSLIHRARERERERETERERDRERDTERQRDRERERERERDVIMFPRLICRSRAKSRFVVDFSILIISLFSVTCIFRSLELASSVSASNVV